MFSGRADGAIGVEGVLFLKGRRYVDIHSVQTLASECAKEEPSFSAMESYGAFLDRFYLTTRYPDALPAPAIPFPTFYEPEARQALDHASKIVEVVRDRIPSESPDSAT